MTSFVLNENKQILFKQKILCSLLLNSNLEEMLN